MSDDKKKFSELVLAERDKGNVVFLAIDSVLTMPVKDIIKQPAEGLLWDLNRDELTALSFMDEEGMTHWVNNFAVALVIKELKRQLDKALKDNIALKRENEGMEKLLKEMGVDGYLQQKADDALLTAEEKEDAQEIL